MTRTSASSRSATRATTKSGSIRGTNGKTITVEEFDRLADLPPDDPEGDLEPYMEWEKAVRPGRRVQRVNVDFPTDLLRRIDAEATRLGVTRQSFIKIRIADTLPK